MAQAYLHDIPFDTFLKYYLNNETDADTISVNARYQPVYIPETVETYFIYKYKVNGGNGEYSIKTIDPPPFDIGAIGRQIFVVDEDLMLATPRLSPEAKDILKKLDRSNKQIMSINDDVYQDILNLQESAFLDPESSYSVTNANDPVYFIPIDDAVSNFFKNLSLYPYYGKIKDHTYYSMFAIESENTKKFYVRILEGGEQEGVNYKAIENVESGIRVITDVIYQDPDYDNICYYSVINTRTKKEVGKIYCLSQQNVLEYNEHNKAHFVDTYKKEGMLNYDLWFDPDDMPISPIMKYHLYMREYKSVVGSVDLDPTTDITKYSVTNTVFYKDFSDHGEIGYSYNYTEQVTSPIILTQVIKQDPVYIQKEIITYEPVPVPTKIKTIVPIVEKISNAVVSLLDGIVHLAEKLIFSNSLTTTAKKPTETAKLTTVKAPGAKKLATLDRPMLRARVLAPLDIISSTPTRVDLANINNSTNHTLDRAMKGINNDITYKAADKISAASKSTIKDNSKQLAVELVKKVEYQTIKVERPDIYIRLQENVEAASNGNITHKFFDTSEIYQLNILSTATIDLSRGVSVSAEAKAITECDHALQKIILEAITGNTIDTTGREYATFAELNAIKNGSNPPEHGTIFKLTALDTDAETGVIYAKNTLLKFNNIDGVKSWSKYVSYTYQMPASGEKDITNLPNNNIVAISGIMNKTKFFQYRNNIFVMTLDRPAKTVKVRTLCKYLIDEIDIMNRCGNMSTEVCDPDTDTRTTRRTDYHIVNTALVTELQKHVSEINDFEKSDALSKLKTYFNNVKFYEKSSVHSHDRVSENILLNKYKDAFYNVAVNTMVSKDSNIYSSSAVTDKFDMYVYVTSLYDNLIKSLTVLPIKNKGGVCYDHKNDTTYFGFMNYDCDLVTFNYIKAREDATTAALPSINYNDVLSHEEQDALMHDIENSNYIRRLLNYRQYNLNAEEFNHRYDDELYRRNYKKIAEVEDVHETFSTENMRGKTYQEQEFSISDILDKSIELYTAYLFANNNKNDRDTENIDLPTSFNRRKLPLYIEKINGARNIFMHDNNGQYQLKHVFKNTNEDKKLFLESLQQKIDRGE